MNPCSPRYGWVGRLLPVTVTLLASTLAGCASSEDPFADAGETGARIDADAATDVTDIDATSDPSDPTETGADLPSADADPAPRVLREDGDWPDCLSEDTCGSSAHGFTGFTVELDPTTGEIVAEGERYDVLEGTIELATGHAFGYDADFIGVRAPARTVVQITVTPADDAPIDPHITTFDGGRPPNGPAFREITANDDRASGDVAARTMLAAPYDDVPFFLWVDDDRNWSGDDAVGGFEYRYRISFITSGFFPIDVDVSGGAVTQPGFVDLAAAGDMHFYRFVPMGGAWRVRFETDNDDFAGALIGFDTGGGDLRPVGLAGDEVGGTPVVLGSGGFVVANNEHVVAVTDWFGRGSNLTGSVFDYTLTFEPDPGGKQ